MAFEEFASHLQGQVWKTPAKENPCSHHQYPGSELGIALELVNELETERELLVLELGHEPSTELGPKPEQGLAEMEFETQLLIEIELEAVEMRNLQP